MEATLVNLVADIRNLSWLFLTLGVLFAGLIGYLAIVSRDIQNLGSEIETLQDTIAKQTNS
jgi:hypothetical protein